MEYFIFLLNLFSWLQLQDWLNKQTGFLIAITGFVAVLLILRKQFKKVIVILNQRRLKIQKWFNTPHIVLERLDNQDAVLKLIKNQVFPNGGSSLSDAISESLKLARKADRRSIILTEHAPTPIYECTGEDGYCTFVNQPLAKLFGMERAEMLGNGWLRAIESDDKVRVYNTFTEAIKNRIPYSCHYTVVNQRTGQRTKCYTSAEVTRGPDDKVIFIHGTVEGVG